MKRICAIAVVLFCGFVPAVAGRVLYVNSATPNGIGTQWNTAFNNLQDALLAAKAGDEIRVAKGIYKPDHGSVIVSRDNRSVFKLVDGVTVRGGFAGPGMIVDANTRNTDLYASILSGDLADNDSLDSTPNNSDNSHHVLSCIGAGPGTVLEGFVISGGTASSGSTSDSGAGMHNIASSPLIRHCIFTGNFADNVGAAILNESGSYPVIVNCTFSGNYALVSGAAIHSSYDSKPRISNCIFWGNNTATVLTENSQISGSVPIITYSCIQGWPNDTGSGNINTNPLFADIHSGDFHLRSRRGRFVIFENTAGTLEELWVLDLITSPCIDAGNPDDGYFLEPQPNGSRVNMGVYGNTRQAAMNRWKVRSDLNQDLRVDLSDLSAVTGNWHNAMHWTAITPVESANLFSDTIRTWHVDKVSGSDTNGGQARLAAFETIQKAINGANDGDNVLVWPGTYSLNEPINFAGKAILLKSAAEPAILKCQYGIGVEFSSGEGADSVLANFIISDCDIGIYIVNALATQSSTSPTITNLTVVGNLFGMYVGPGSNPEVSNSIFWNNSQSNVFCLENHCRIRYNCIQNGHTGLGNIKSNPQFADISNGDYHLLSKTGRFFINSPAPDYLQNVWVLDRMSSPCIDAGDPNTYPMDELVTGGGRVNMGAYGAMRYASKSNWLLRGDIDRNGVVELKDLANLAGDWLTVAPWIE
jgi:hypothetical protein